MRTATVEATKKLINACKPSDLKSRAYIDLAFHSGLRPAELCALRWQDIDLEARTVVVRRGKGGKCRTVSLAETYGWVQLWRQQASGEYVFATSSGRPWQTSHVRRLFGRLCEKAGVSVSPHGMRHGHAASVWHQTKDLALVSRQLGHAYLSTTDEYLKDIQVDLGRVAELAF